MTVSIDNVNLELVHNLSKAFYMIPMHATKQAGISNWQNRHGDQQCNGDINWANYSAAGVLLGHESPLKPGYKPIALDFDTYSPSIFKKMLAATENLLGRAVPYRVGHAPKFLILAYVPLDCFPHKLRSDKYIDDKGRTNQCELLTKGQFVGVVGKITDKNNVPHTYTWNNVSGIDEHIAITLTEDRVLSLLATFDDICNKKGLHVKSKGSKDLYTARDRDDLDISISDINNEPLDMSLDEVKTLLMDYPAEQLDYDGWLEVGCALSHQYDNREIGYKLWLRWSEQSSKHKSAKMWRKWQSFINEKDENVTLRTVIHRADRKPALELINTLPSSLIKTEASYIARDDFLNEPWVIEGLLRDNELCMVFGKPGHGKTFYALDMLCHIARGIQYQGHYTESRPVVYIAAEAALGVRKRLAVWREYFGHDASDNFYLTEIAVPLTDKAAIKQLIKEIGDLGLDRPIICFDTLAAVSGGLNENDTRDMNNATGLFRALINELNSSIIVVHHSGRGDDTRARGSSVLDGAMDVIVKIEKDEANLVEAKITKIKDGEGLELQAKTFHKVSIGTSNVTGNEVYSAVLIEPEDCFEDENNSSLSSDPRLDDIRASIDTVPMERSLFGLIGVLFDDNPVLIRSELAKDYCELAGIEDARNPTYRRKFAVALSTLCDNGAVKIKRVTSKIIEVRPGKKFAEYDEKTFSHRSCCRYTTYNRLC